MLAHSPTNLQEHILTLLSEKRSLTAKQLQLVAAKRYRACSIQAVYKELRNLMETGVVVKANKKYSLSLPWILQSYAFVEKAYENYFENAALDDLLPAGEKRAVWKFRDLKRADDLWIQAVLALIQELKTDTVYGWIPHPWFSIIHYQKDVRFQDSLRLQGAKYYFMIGGETFLDKHFAEEWPKDVYFVSMAPGPFDDKRDLYLNVIGDYILTISVDEKTQQRIDDFFDSICTLQELTLAKSLSLFDSQAAIKVSLERHAVKAKKLSKSFSSYFGH